MTHRARAIAIAERRRPEPSPWLFWLVLACLVLAGVAAHGQTARGQTAGSQTAGGQTARPNAPVPTTPVPAGPGGGVSGVLRPTTPVDPGIHAPSPAASAFPMPVVKPPGTPGGNQLVVPK